MSELLVLGNGGTSGGWWMQKPLDHHALYLPALSLAFAEKRPAQERQKWREWACPFGALLLSMPSK